jgi:hypothetical protein
MTVFDKCLTPTVFGQMSALLYVIGPPRQALDAEGAKERDRPLCICLFAMRRIVSILGLTIGGW